MVKTLKIFFSGTRSLLIMKLGMQHRGLEIFKVYIYMMAPGMTSTYFTARSNHKRPYKARFIANSSSCTTTSLYEVLTFCLTAIKKHWIKYCEKTYEREGINYFWSIKNSTEIFNKLKTKGFQASTIFTYDFLCFILRYHII